jgi:hypothetical protein
VSSKVRRKFGKRLDDADVVRDVEKYHSWTHPTTRGVAVFLFLDLLPPPSIDGDSYTDGKTATPCLGLGGILGSLSGDEKIEGKNLAKAGNPE